MQQALEAWLEAAARGEGRVGAARAAAEVDAGRPWEVLAHAGLLARCRVELAEEDLGLTRGLKLRKPDGAGVIAVVRAGEPYPAWDKSGRRSRGAFDTPPEMARETVARALDVARVRVQSGMDPACGTGTFLVAMCEAGIAEVRGSDLDEAALAVARVAAPDARVERADALEPRGIVDLVAGNPPFVPPERQDKQLRERLRARFPWLRGRFDLVVPFVAVAMQSVRPGGVVSLILPAAAMVQNYGAPLRRQLAAHHHVTHLDGPMPFPGASVDVVRLVMVSEDGPAMVADTGVHAEELLRLEHVPLVSSMAPGDVALVEKVRENSVPLGELAVVDTGVVAHGIHGSKDRLIHDEPAPGRVCYADARGFFAGERRWLEYAPDRMHRAKRPEMFERPKIVIQRLRGSGPVRAEIDRDGVYVGHTCTVVTPEKERVPLERLLELVRSPLASGLIRIERGARLDLYPRDVAGLPVPRTWLEQPDMPLAEAWGIDEHQQARLGQLGVGA
ncbi:MAG: hypothetical protein EP330_20685 [Deltaproteobacteria bacterium]|nr:MAG: hypothetical protein EP330_20685 [Deltaproteobacteria bacterium]